MRGRRSLLITQTVLFACTLGILNSSNEGEALFDNLLEVSSFSFLFKYQMRRWRSLIFLGEVPLFLFLISLKKYLDEWGELLG